MLTRREALGGLAAAALSVAKPAPVSTVAIARCQSYQEDLYTKLGKMFDQIGGIGPLVKNKTVALKLNLTGNPRRFPLDPAMPYRTQPDTVLATVRLLAKNGARRVRIIETFFPAKQDMALWGRYNLDISAINNAGCKVEWENCQNLGQGSKYVTLKVPGGGYIFPSYDLNHSFVDCDTYVSMSKLKNHWIAGVTMSLKNNFGITPCSLYGGDCGTSGNEDPQQERGPVCHNGARTPPQGVAQEIDMSTPSRFRLPGSAHRCRSRASPAHRPRHRGRRRVHPRRRRCVEPGRPDHQAGIAAGGQESSLSRRGLHGRDGLRSEVRPWNQAVRSRRQHAETGRSQGSRNDRPGPDRGGRPQYQGRLPRLRTRSGGPHNLKLAICVHLCPSVAYSSGSWTPR